MPAFPYLLKSSSHPNPEPREGRRTRPHLGTPLCTPAPALAPKHASSPWGSSRDSVLRARYVASCPQTTDIEGPQCSDQQPRGRGALRLITAPLLTAGAAQPLWTPFFTCKPGCLELLPGLPVNKQTPTRCEFHRANNCGFRWSCPGAYLVLLATDDIPTPHPTHHTAVSTGETDTLVFTSVQK